MGAGFTTGGSVHVVVNNQVGFTTVPVDGHATAHPTDVAKIVGAPVLHVNADSPDAVVRAFELAADWRARFRRDIVVDLVGYRRCGLGSYPFLQMLHELRHLVRSASSCAREFW